MEAILLSLVVAVVILGLIAFDLLALRFGVDSRGSVGDTHGRPSSL